MRPPPRTRSTYPVVAKLCGEGIAHKTERGLVRLRLGTPPPVRDAAGDLLAAATPEDGDGHRPRRSDDRRCSVSSSPACRSTRSSVPTVMVGVGGVLAEAIADVSIRLVPDHASSTRAEMLDDLATQVLLGRFRGEPTVDRDAMVDILLSPCPGRRRDHTGSAIDRPEPAHRQRGSAGRGRRAGRARRSRCA